MTKKPNKILYQDKDITKLEMNKGLVLIIDTEDYDRIKGYRWCASSNDNRWEVRCTLNYGRTPISLHRFILNAPKGRLVDHINHNTLDNRKSNLRLCSNLENSRNKQNIKREGSTSIYKGVSVCRSETGKPKYRADINTGSKQLQIGVFDLELDAALAYNEAATRYHGKFACINDIEVEPGYKGQYTVDGSYLKYIEKYRGKDRRLVQNEVIYQDDTIVKFKIGNPAGVCVVDRSVYDIIRDRHWELDNKGQVVERSVGDNVYRLSKFITNHSLEEFVTYKNGDKKDLRRENIKVNNFTANRIIFEDDTIMHIELFNGSYFIIDRDRYDLIKDHRWVTDHKEGRVYVITSIEGRSVNIRKLLYKYEDGTTPYHINGNRLDFRQSNIELLTSKELANKYQPTTINTVIYKDSSIAKIDIGKGVVITIDREDLDKVLLYRWKYNVRKKYVETRSSPYKQGITMQRYIMNPSKECKAMYRSTDHTDYRKTNLYIRGKS